MIALRASFTALSVPNASATSGSSLARFVPPRKDAAYLPRTPPDIRAKSYSGSSSSLSLSFFIESTLLVALRALMMRISSSLWSVWETTRTRPRSERPTAIQRCSEPELRIRTWVGPAKRLAKNRRCLVEGHAMFGKVRCRLPLIPVESHARRIPRRSSTWAPAHLARSKQPWRQPPRGDQAQPDACSGRVTACRLSGAAGGRVRLQPVGCAPTCSVA